MKFVAKGSRGKLKRPKSKIDLFNIAGFIFYRSHRGDLHTLGECHTAETFNNLRADLYKFATASYFTELLDLFTVVEDPNEELFSLIENTFKNLEAGKDPKFLRCLLEIKLMQYTGHIPDFSKFEDVSNGTKAVIKNILDSRALDRLKLSAAQISEINSLLRLAIDYLLGKRVKSLSFLESMGVG